LSTAGVIAGTTIHGRRAFNEDRTKTYTSLIFLIAKSATDDRGHLNSHPLATRIGVFMQALGRAAPNYCTL
jgi:hypothetical protein